MELIKKKIPWLIKVALKYVLRWLLQEALEELREGIVIKVPIEGKVYNVCVKLKEPNDKASRILLL